MLRCLAIAAVLLLGACSSELDREARNARAAQALDPILIGLAWSAERNQWFNEGAYLAAEEINAAGGVLGRPIEFVSVDDSLGDQPPGDVAHTVARRLVAYPDLIAVIGHPSTGVAIPASIVYNEHGILYLAPSSTKMSLTGHGFRYVFRVVPNNSLWAEQLAAFAAGQGFRRVVVLHSRIDWANELATLFAKAANELDMDIVHYDSYFPRRTDFREILADLAAKQADALFIGSSPETLLMIVRQSREMGMQVPVLSGDWLHPDQVLSELGDAANGIITTVLLNPDAQDGKVRTFIDAFTARFETPPDGWAAQSYDAVHLLAYTMEKARSAVPLALATYMRYSLSWEGISGRYSFQRNGDIYTKKFDFAVLDGGQVVYIPASD